MASARFPLLGLRSRLYLFIMVCIWSGMVHGRDFVALAGSTIRLYMPPVQRPVAHTARDMFAGDVQRVLGCDIKPAKSPRKADISLGISAELPREGFRVYVHDGRLYIVGADEHGLAYGLMQVSRLMGVSPWEYWADCTPRRLDRFTLPDGYTDEQRPAVAYRGIFINDEDWGLNPWATRQHPEAWSIRQGGIKGAIGPEVNERIFQLMLRLRANYYWPAMHECSQPFFTIQGNRQMAARYGIYIGGSHCEPMATSPAAEWGISGQGDYNYVTNASAVKAFWQQRLDQVKDQEIVYTLGMRGVHDGSMQGVKTMADNVKYLQMVLDDQRRMLQRTHPRGTGVPQVFVPYKEVLDIYKSGLRVPDDVTLMWTDDNYGYIRHFPDSAERQRRGGHGVYYHVSYWGRPHDYLWLNSLSPDLLQRQMLMAYAGGIRQMWMLNVGDIKPSEFQIELFMQLAWDGRGYGHPHAGRVGDTPAEDSDSFLQYFVQREFGSALQQDIVDVLRTYFRLSAEMKPEHMAGTRVEESDRAYWNQIHPILGDWTAGRVRDRVAAYQRISDRVEALWQQVPADRRDAFYELVKYPVQAAAQMNFKFLCPERCQAAYDSIQSLTHIYNRVCAGGKWNGIMSAQPRNLPVFQRVQAESLPRYPEASIWQPLEPEGIHPSAEAQTVYRAVTPLGTDSITIRVHLCPNHPIQGGRLAFCLQCDGIRTPDVEYQTYDRSEEWKQNVLRGYAIRDVRVAVSRSRTRHDVVFVPRTLGVELHGPYSIYVHK